MANDVFSMLREKNFESGTVFIVSRANFAVKLQVYHGVIITAGSLHMSLDQIEDILASGDVKQMSFAPSVVLPGAAQPAVIVRTFPASDAYAPGPDRSVPSRLLQIVRLMPGLMRADTNQGRMAFDVMRRHLSRLYPGFLTDIPAIKTRINRLNEEFGVPANALERTPMPSDLHAIPEWVFRNFDVFAENPMKEVALYFIIFGEIVKKTIMTTTERSTSLGAKEGHAKLSKVAYAEGKDSGSISIYNGIVQLGKMKIDWDRNDKKTVIMTKADLDRLGLQSGDKLNLILED
jgi:hypothetical protein